MVETVESSKRTDSKDITRKEESEQNNSNNIIIEKETGKYHRRPRK